MAAQEGKVDVIKLLIEAEAQVDIEAQVCKPAYVHTSTLMSNVFYTPWFTLILLK